MPAVIVSRDRFHGQNAGKSPARVAFVVERAKNIFPVIYIRFAAGLALVLASRGHPMDEGVLGGFLNEQF